MFDQKLYSDNLVLLHLINASLANKVSSLLNGQAISITPCMTHEKANLLVRQGDKTYFLHSEQDPLQEAKEWYSGLNLANCDVLYIYGLGLGYLYQELKDWLNSSPNRYLIFLEDELAVVHYFLGSEFAASLLKDPQVDIRDFSEAQYDRSIVRLLTQDNILRSFSVAALPSYATNKTPFFSMIQDLIEFETAEQNIRYQELAQFGVLFFNNFYRNLLQLPHSYLADHLTNAFKDIPAIICGAGPSLVNHVSQLKELHQKALLFGPGSALNVLTHQGVWPHFGVSIDPTAETFHRQIMNRAFETPIFYRNRLYYEALTAIHGPRLFLTGAVFYLAAKWFEEQLDLPSLQLEGGYNVVHASLEIARFLGCNPIIFVGLDLSFREGEHYASGVERHPLFPEKTEQKTHLGPPIEVKNIKGEKVWSYWPWIAEAQWTDLYSRAHPDLRLINASDEGIGLFSIPNLSLQEISETYLTQTFELEQLIHKAIQETGPVPTDRNKIERCIQTFYHSLKQCETICLTILHLSEHESSQELEDSLKKEVGFNYLLQQFDDFFATFIQKDLRNLKRLPEEERVQRQRQLMEERYRFLLQTARVNLKIIENTLKEQQTSPSPLSSPSSEPSADIQKPAYYASGSLYSIPGSSEHPRQGSYLYYYEDGTLKTELNYKHGHLDGVVRLYYPTGHLKRELFFHQGQREGTEKSWYENGQLFTEVDYHQNIAKRARCWFPDGTLAKDITL